LSFLVAAALWSVVIAAAVITILLGSFALAGGRPNLANLVGLVALCIGFTPLISGISLGQEVLPALAGVIAALWLGRRRGGWSSGVVTLFCGFKPTIAALLVPLRSPDHVLAGRTSARLHRARTSRGQRGLGNRAASQRPERLTRGGASLRGVSLAGSAMLFFATVALCAPNASPSGGLACSRRPS